MPKLDLDAIPQTDATGYPPEFADRIKGRNYRRLSPASGIEDFGASHVVLDPGAWSSQRHWHEGEDELLVMTVGEAVLVDDNGETALRPGDIAVFPKHDGNGHTVQNRSDAPCAYVVVGKPSATACHYPDIDMHLPAGGPFTRKDGSAF